MHSLMGQVPHWCKITTHWSRLWHLPDDQWRLSSVGCPNKKWWLHRPVEIHNYIFGTKFQIESNHKPLVPSHGEKTSINCHLACFDYFEYSYIRVSCTCPVEIIRHIRRNVKLQEETEVHIVEWGDLRQQRNAWWYRLTKKLHMHIYNER